MKTLLLLALSLSAQLTFASSLEGTYKAIKTCRPNSIRLSPIIMMTERTEINIKLDLENQVILFTNQYQESIELPLTSKNNFEPMFFKKFFKNAKVQYDDNSYVFATKGTELQKSDNYPLPGSHFELVKWNDRLALEVNEMGNITVNWKIDDTSGICELKRL